MLYGGARDENASREVGTVDRLMRMGVQCTPLIRRQNHLCAFGLHVGRCPLLPFPM